MELSRLDRAAQSVSLHGPDSRPRGFPLPELRLNVRYGGLSDSEDEASADGAPQGCEISETLSQGSGGNSPSSPGQSLECTPVSTESSYRSIPENFVANEVQAFVRSLQEPKYASPLSGREIGQLFQSFYSMAELKLETCTPGDQPLLSQEERTVVEKGAKAYRQQVSETLDALESTATEQLYPKIFENAVGDDRKRCARFEARLDALRRHPVLLDQLHLDFDWDTRQRLEPAVACFSLVASARTPAAKLGHIVDAHCAIAEALDKYSHTGADMLLPALVYVILASHVPGLLKNYLFTRRFRRASAIYGQYEYCLINLEAALQVLNGLHFAPEQLPPDVDPTLFTLTDSDPTFSESPPRAPAHGRAASRSRSTSQSSHSSVLSNTLQNRLGSLSVTVSNSARSLVGYFSRDDTLLGDRLFPELVETTKTRPPPKSRSVSVSSPSTGGASPETERPPIVHSFMNAELKDLTIADVSRLLAEYKKLARYLNQD